MCTHVPFYFLHLSKAPLCLVYPFPSISRVWDLAIGLSLWENMKRSRSINQAKVEIMDAQNNPWSRDRTMRIIIQDDTYKDVINWKSLPKSFLPDNIDLAKEDGRSESKVFLLMVEPDDSTAAVKAYIQEDKGIPFKKQKLLNEDGGVMRDAQTLVSAGITKGCTLILRYAPITPITVLMPSCRMLKLMIESDDTIADVKAAIQEKEGIRFHKQRLMFYGRAFEDSKSLVDCGIQYESQLDLMLRMCGC